MSKKEERAVKDQGDISDSVRAIVMRRVIIPPNFTNLALQVNYFTPRFKKVSRGENIQWVNQDNGIHHLQFYDLSDDRMELLFNSGPIEPGNSFERKFNTDLIRIDYICS